MTEQKLGVNIFFLPFNHLLKNWQSFVSNYSHLLPRPAPCYPNHEKVKDN